MKKIQFNSPNLTNKEIFYIKDVFKENKFYGAGKYTIRCENLIAKKVKNNKVLLTDSCTSALEISALIIKKTIFDEVIMPSYTFTSTASAFLKAGFKIRFVDVDPLNAMIDPDKIEKNINKNTRAIVAVHYAGFAAQIKKIKRLCSSYKIALVEDAAQGFNCFLNNKSLGTFGDFGCFSFHESKNIHAGLSGALVLKKLSDYKRAINIRDRGTNRNDMIKNLKKKYSWVELGGSYHPTELQSAFLYPQLKSVNLNTKKRKELFLYYSYHLNGLLEIGKIFYQVDSKNYKSNYHAMCIFLKNKSIREKLRKYLLRKNIQAVFHYSPLHSSKVGKSLGYKSNDFPVTNTISNTILRLPLHNNMEFEDIEYICSNIHSFFLN